VGLFVLLCSDESINPWILGNLISKIPLFVRLTDLRDEGKAGRRAARSVESRRGGCHDATWSEAGACGFRPVATAACMLGARGLGHGGPACEGEHEGRRAEPGQVGLPPRLHPYGPHVEGGRRLSAASTRRTLALHGLVDRIRTLAVPNIAFREPVYGVKPRRARRSQLIRTCSRSSSVSKHSSFSRQGAFLTTSSLS
jgi:hypothetical protein